MSGTYKWRKVEKEEFYNEVGPKDCHPSIINDRSPYTSVFRTPRGQSVGMVVGLDTHSGFNDYFLPAYVEE